MQYTRDELVILAKAYLEALDVGPYELGRQIIPHNDRLLVTLLSGRDCSSLSGHAASLWFYENWPQHLKWPSGVPRPVRQMLGKASRLVARRRRSAGNGRGRGQQPPTKAVAEGRADGATYRR